MNAIIIPAPGRSADQLENILMELNRKI